MLLPVVHVGAHYKSCTQNIERQPANRDNSQNLSAVSGKAYNLIYQKID